MALPAVHLTDVIPEPIRSVFTKGGQKVSAGAKAAADPAWTRAIRPAWDAYVRADPVGAEMIRQMNPNSPAGLLSLGSILVPGAKGGGRIAGTLGEGRPTPAQASLLKAIYRSSRGNKALYQIDSPSAGALGALTGAPAQQRAAIPGGSPLAFARALDPLKAMERAGEVLDPFGGQLPRSHVGGMDVPPRPGVVTDYFGPLTPAEQNLLLRRILLGHERN